MDKSKPWIALWLALIALAPGRLCAQEEKSAKGKDENPAHDELRAFKKSLVDAVKKGDLEEQLKHAHKDIVVTWQNGETVRGIDALREFYKKNVSQQKIFQGYKEPPEPAELTILHGDNAGISYGTSVAHYKLLGMEFDLKNHWTATVVKDGGQWKIAAYHVSGNILDNPVLNAAKNWLYWVGGIALAAGLIVGLLIGRRRARATA